MRPSSVLVAIMTAIVLSACGGGSTNENVPPPKNEPPPVLDAVDTRAGQLADQAVAGTEVNLPALQEALTASGIAVRALDGTVLTAPEEPSQGLALAEHDPEALAHLQAKTGTVTLAELGENLATTIEGASGSIMAEHLLEGLRAQAQSEVPTMRFWARYIVELGRKSAEPYDLLGEVTPTEVHLDAVQHTLILLRLAGDAALAAEKYSGQAVQDSILETTSGKPNCTFLGIEGTIMDGAATAAGYGFGKFLEYLESVLDKAGVKGVEKYTRITNLGNLAISYIKLAFSFLIFDMQIELDAAPLVRTKSTLRNGDGVHTAKVTVSYDFSAGIQYINCLRLALNAAGFDVSVPNVGAVEGAEITWTTFAADDPSTYVGARTNIVAALPGEEVRRDPTNAQGVAEVRFEGLKQKRDLGSNPQQVKKQGVARAVTTLKTADIAQDLVDAIGTALGGPLTVVPELFNRMWPISASVQFPVVDWKLGCADVSSNESCWTGTITYTKTDTYNTVYESEDPCSGGGRTCYTRNTFDVSTTIEETWTLTGAGPNEIRNYPANFVMTVEHSETSENFATGYNSCGRQSGGIDYTDRTTTSSRVETASASLSAEAYNVSITLNRGVDGQEYLISGWGPDEGSASGTFKWQESYRDGPGCEGDYYENTKSGSSVYEYPAQPASVTGTIDPNNPNVLSGSAVIYEYKDEDTDTRTVVTWNLTRK